MWRGCVPDPVVRSVPPLPHVRGSPALRVLPAGPTSTAAFASLRSDLSRWAYSINSIKTTVDLPGPSTRPSPSVPCSQTPPGSPAPSPLADAYSCLPRLQPCRPPDFMVTRLDRFPCSTARTSPYLRLAHVVTSMSPRLGSRWVASPCRGGNCTRWTRQICPGAL